MPILPVVIEDIPYNDAVVAKDKDGQLLITDIWGRYFSDALQPQIDASTKLAQTFESLGRNSAITITALLPSAVAGKYRFNSYIQIVTPDGASSSVQLSLTYTVNGIVQTETFAVVNGNTITTRQSALYFFRADEASPISIAATYASGTPSAMRYDISIDLELVEA